MYHGTNTANANGCDIFASIHMNAFTGSANGTEVWLYNSADAFMNEIARQIVSNFAAKGYTSRGVKYNTPADYAAKYGYQKAQYRVSPINDNGYYSWQYDSERGNGMDGYAGCFGIAIDKFQLC